MIFDPLPRYPRGVRFRLCTHTHTHTQAAKPRPGAGRRRDADEIGISMRVIVGSPGAGQYRVFSSVREHSKHRATMAQNGRQLPDTLLSREPPSLSLYLSVCLSIFLSLFLLGGTKWKKRTSSLLGEWSFDGKFFRTYTFLTKLRVQSYIQVLEQTHSYLLVYLFICLDDIIRFRHSMTLPIILYLYRFY